MWNIFLNKWRLRFQEPDPSDGGGGGGGEGDGGGITFLADKDGNFVDGWKDLLDEDIRQSPSLDTVPNVKLMARKMINLEQKLGKDRYTIPDDKTAKEEREAFYKALGRPDSPEGYKAQVPDEMAQIFDKDRVDSLRKIAHELGATDKQFQAYLKYEMDQVAQMLGDQEQADIDTVEQTKAEMIKRWGNAYEERKHLADRYITTMSNGDKELELRLLEKFGNDVDFIELCSNSGVKLLEHSVLKGETPTTPTIKEAEDKITELRSTPGYMWRAEDGTLLEESDPAKHRMITAEIQRLIKKAYPEATQG